MQQHHHHQQHHQHPHMAHTRAHELVRREVVGDVDPYRQRHQIGLALYMILMGIGAVLLMIFFVALPVLQDGLAETATRTLLGGAVALPAMLVYLFASRLLDRFDPEPAYALLLCVLWGAIGACGYAVTINSLFAGVAVATGTAEGDATAFAAVVSAPLVEEFFKGVMVAGVFYFLRNEFDGVVDGIIYATFTAIGFAAVENILYYANASREGAGTFVATFIIRGVLAPWGHPLYTSMTGIGFGISRETTNPWVRVFAPAIGFFGAVFLHFAWNGTAVLSQGMGMPGLFLLALPLWFLFVAAFLVMVMVLVHRRSKVIRRFSMDEVALGRISQAELDLVCSVFGSMTARTRKGKLGVEFVRAIARLALVKWHVTRAQKMSQHTRSMDFVAPLRVNIESLRARGASPV